MINLKNTVHDWMDTVDTGIIISLYLQQYRIRESSPPLLSQTFLSDKVTAVKSTERKWG